MLTTKIRNYGMVGYSVFIRPLPIVIRKAILSYWITIVVNWIADALLRKVNRT